MQKRNIPDPHGGSGRVEGLVIGVVPAITGVGAIVTAVVVGVTAFFSISAQLTAMQVQLRTTVLLLSSDRWTRSDQLSLCRWQETNGKGGCPQPLPNSVDLGKVLEKLQ